MRLITAVREGRRLLPSALLAVLLLPGCSPDTFLALDENRERNLVRAQNEESIKQYDTAAKYYLLALEKNPRSPLAHLGYASICHNNLSRYADAVYHYQRYLELQPSDPKAEDIRQRITNCLERLATRVPVAIRTESIARDLEAARRENLSLRGQVSNLLTAGLILTNEVTRLSQIAASQGTELQNLQSRLQLQAQAQAQLQAQALAQSAQLSPGTGQGTGPGRVGSGARTSVTTDSRSASTTPRTTTPLPRNELRTPNPRSTSTPVTTRSTTTYRVVRGDTLASIARRHGVSLAALERANPGLSAHRLQPGTVLRIPPR